MKIPQSTIRLLTWRVGKILLNREVSIMKVNTQNEKLKRLQKQLWYSGSMSEVKHTMPELLIIEVSSIQRNLLNLVIQKLDL